MYGGHIRHGLPILGGAGAIFGGNDRGDRDNTFIGGGHCGSGPCGPGGPGGPGPGGHPLGGGGVASGMHGMPAGPHGALPFTGFDSIKLALIALLLVIGGLLLMRMVMMLSNDN
jgi:hypothetical protein